MEERRTNVQKDYGLPLQKNPDFSSGDFLSRDYQILPELREDFVYLLRFSVDSVEGCGLEI